MKLPNYAWSVISLSVLALTGCNSSDDEYLRASELERMENREGHLAKASADKVALTIKNGVFLSRYGYLDYNCNPCAAVDATAEVAADDGSKSDFSGTTTQEQGVAESDRVKYDGDTLYLASNKHNYYYEVAQSSDEPSAFIRLLDRNDDDSLSEASTVALDSNATNVDDLYLHNKQLAALYNVYEPVEGDNPVTTDAITIDIWYPYENKFGLSFFDASNSAEVKANGTFTVDGYVLSSRRIEDKVYVVSSYTPSYYIDTYPESEQAQQVAYENIVDLDNDQLLPNISYGDVTEPLVSMDSCYLPTGSQDIHGHSSVVTLTTFDINNPSQRDSVCIVAPIHGFYASPTSIYFYSTVYPESTDNDENYVAKTQIHQFEFTANSADYVATGAVEGTLGWQNPHLRFSERNGHLRVVTTDWYGENSPEHQLFVLSENQQTLEVVSQLPNDDRPAKIGKPNEDIYAVRYFEDKAYVVTFRRRDPLYVIDLSEPSDPFIQGELDIPGYSAYLQPLNENLVLGIGQQLDDGAGGLEPVQNGDIIEGAKAELYDVSNPASPQLVSTIVYENGYSPVEYDYHALTQLQLSEQDYRVAFPVIKWQQSENSDGSINWDYISSMELLNINLTTPEMSTNGNLQVESDYFGGWGDRSVIHGNVIYYVKDNQVWQSYWSTPSTINGPY